MHDRSCMYMYFCLHDTIEPVHLYIYTLPNPYKIRSDQNLVTVDTPVSIAIAIAMTVGMTIGTIFVCPVRLDICQRPFDVEKHIRLLRPDSRESSRRHFVISSFFSLHSIFRPGNEVRHTFIIITMPPFP